MKTFRFASVLIAFVLSASCASIPIKQQAAVSLQTAEAAVSAAQTLERALCFNDPATEHGTQCTNPLAAAVGLMALVADPRSKTTPPAVISRHVWFAEQFEAIYTAQIAAATEIETWQAGAPAPPGFTLYAANVQQVLGLAQALITSNPAVAAFVAKVQAAVIATQQIAAQFGA